MAYTPEEVEQVCERIENGSEGTRSILKSLEMTPSRFWKTLETNPECQERYVRAKERQAELMADDILEISDDGTNDWMDRRNDKGEVIGEMVNAEVVQRSRLRVESRKWVAAKLLPKKYGEKQEIEHTGNVKAYVTFDPAKDLH